ncbi:MAG TPA: glycosyltransferase [Solirubrobacter sp.]
MPKPLVVIPSYLSQPSDVDLLAACVSSLRRTAGDAVDILVVDDGSPAPGLVDAFASAAAEHRVELVRQASNEGFARAVNVGLERARAEHREAVLVNADIVAITDGWLELCRAADAGIVGAVLLSPRGPIAHAGFYFSRVTGTVEHRFAGAPADLPATLEVAACPVSGAFQYIRPDVLAVIGVYDPEFRMGSEDLDFCLRAADAGFGSVCQGRVRAVHVEAAFRGRPSPKLDAWHAQSYARFWAKWSPAQLSERVADVPAPGAAAADTGGVRALFVGQAGPASLYHRVVLPATALGGDWCTAQSARQLAPGYVLEDYDTVVIQMPSTPDWLDAIARLRRRGARVFYEVDWYLHAHVGDAPTLRGIETLMRACDGVLCATPFLGEHYAAFNANVRVCENALDPRGYALAKPARDTVTIGCASTTLTVEDVAESVTAIAEVLRERPNVRFASLGQPVADLAANLVGADRCTALPMVLVEQYPAALSTFDILFEPPAVPPRRRGRSQLRWLEASALGTPLVGDPETYPNAVPARDADELAQQLLRLVDDASLRARIGETARRTVIAGHTMTSAAADWAHALTSRG